jgi:YfiH family protein
MSNAAEVLDAPRLRDAGFRHGFSTRRGGTSQGAYGTLNLGRNVGDDAARVADNLARFASAVGFAPDALFDLSQVHGRAVVVLRGNERPAEVRARHGDALVATESGTTVAVRTADCVPVLLGDRASGAVGAIHAGWRGVVAGVVREAVLALQNGRAAELVAGIGPSIGPCCFEVDADVAAELARTAGDGIVIRRGMGKPHVDLWRAVEHQLRAAGVEVIDTLGRCTVCEGDQFFSYRRDGNASGRMLSAIVVRSH